MSSRRLMRPRLLLAFDHAASFRMTLVDAPAADEAAVRLMYVRIRR